MSQQHACRGKLLYFHFAFTALLVAGQYLEGPVAGHLDTWLFGFPLSSSKG
jgi:hypothetical protein